MTPDEKREELQVIKDSAELRGFHEDIRAEVARDLPNYDKQREPLDEKPANELLMIYMNWRSRLIHAHPRGIHFSAELSARMRSNDSLLAPFRKNFDHLVKMIETGEDLTDFLSSRIKKSYKLQPNFRKLKAEKHLDLLLNEQGIHHLHLPGLKNQKGTPILFAIFEQEHAFILDIAPHNDWSTDRLARISYRNWEQRHFVVLLMDGLSDGKGNPIHMKDHERVSVRNNAVSTPIKIEEGLFVFARRGPLAANGYSHSVVWQCDRIWNSLVRFEIRRRSPNFREYFSEKTGKTLPESPKFHFRFYDTHEEWAYAIIEEHSNVAFLLPQDFE